MCGVGKAVIAVFMCLPTMFMLSSVRSGLGFWMLNSHHTLFHRPLSPTLTSFIPYAFNQCSISCHVLQFLCFCVHISPPPLPHLLGGRLNSHQSSPVQSSSHQSSIFGFLFLLFFTLGIRLLCRFSCTSFLGNSDIYFLSRFEHAVITVSLLLTLISWLKRLCVMSNACGDSWSCKITRARPRWQEKRTHSERLKERAQGAAWRKDKRALFIFYFWNLIKRIKGSFKIE